MSIDLLHEKIRRLKNPSMMDLGIKAESMPPHIVQEENDTCKAYARFCRELLEGLKGIVPAVRFPFGAFALFGADGLNALTQLLKLAGELGYYVVLDCPEINTPWGADRAAEQIFDGQLYPCDALVISPYIGSDAIKPFVPYCKQGKALFVIVRSPNKTALELQDLMTGSRLVHGAAAELANRHGETVLTKCGYSQIGALVSAGNPQSIMTLRAKHNRMYMLVDGIDYPSGNAKNCSYAFDRFGYGAVVCAGPQLTAAWKEAEADGRDYVSQAVQAAERIKKNITRYVTIL